VKKLHVDEIEGLPVFGTLVWKPIRRPLGVTAFGINAYTAANGGDQVVEEHTELTTAVGQDERLRESARDDEDFESLRSDPGFPA
jgi:hypothetical protein